MRWTGTDEAMIELAKKNALAIGAGLGVGIGVSLIAASMVWQ